VPCAPLVEAPLALLCSVPLECRHLLAQLAAPRELRVGRKPAWDGVLAGAPVLLMPTGMGKSNAAHAVTAVLETREVRAVVCFGVAGAFPGAALELGEVALASAEVYGDEGVESPTGWLSTEQMGIPLLEMSGRPVFNQIEVDAALVGRARAALEATGIKTRVGPFVTVSTCSGTALRGAELARRSGAICEAMEGAAVAHVAALYEVPFLELRAVSNRVEDRDLSRWRLDEAAAAAQDALQVLVAAAARLFTGSDVAGTAAAVAP
jgi:futalosine hydrolase